MRKLFLLPLLLCLTLACTFTWPIQPAVPSATVTMMPDSPIAGPPSPAIIATISPTVEQVWTAYENERYGYGISFPQTYAVNVVGDEYVELGDKIVIVVWDIDPTQPLGDKPIIESSTDVQIGQNSGRLLTGYIGVIGGFVPQQIREYVFQHNDYFLTITLHAIGLRATGGDLTQIVHLNPDDVSKFDAIVESLRFR